MVRNRLLMLLMGLLAAAAPARAQITIPYSFTYQTIIDQDQVNSNFTTIGNSALNRTGGTVTGALTSAGGSLAGSWAGSPTIAGTPTLSGTMTVSGTMTSATGAITGTWSGGPTMSGTWTFSSKLTASNNVISLRSVDYTLPAANAAGVLTNNGAGTLSWTPVTNTLLDGSAHTDTTNSTVVRGDVIVGNNTPKWTRLALGTASKLLRSDGTDASWSWPNVSTQSGTFTATDGVDVYIVSAAATVNLPTCTGRSGKLFEVKSTTTGTITIDPNAAETIDGAATFAFTQQYASVTIVCDGTAWSIL